MIKPAGATLVIAWVVSSLAAARPAQAQELRVGVARVHADHDLLGIPTALDASIGAGLTPRVGVRLGIQHGGDEFSSVGTTCMGLVFPGADCGGEARREESTISALFVRLPVTRLLGWARVGFVPEVRRLAMKSRQEGTASGRVRTAEKVAWGLGLGAELDVFVWDRPGVALHAGVHAAMHPWFEEELIADGYTPFERSVSLVWVEVGMSLRPGGPR